MEIGCEDGRWMELDQNRVQWRALVLAMLNIGVLLPVLDDTEIGCEDGRWMELAQAGFQNSQVAISI
jgi:hypothetical protein